MSNSFWSLQIFYENMWFVFKEKPNRHFFYIYIYKIKDFPGGSDGKESACSPGDPGLIWGQEDPLEKEMATYSSVLAWEITWIEEPGGL